MDSLEDRGDRGDTLFIGENVSEQTVQRKVLCADEEVKHQWAEITVLPPAGQLGYNYKWHQATQEMKHFFKVNRTGYGTKPQHVNE